MPEGVAQGDEVGSPARRQGCSEEGTDSMRRALVVVAVLLIVALGAGAIVATAALAEARRQHQTEIQELQGEVSASQESLEKLQGELQTLRSDLSDSEDRVAEAATALNRSNANVRRFRDAYDNLLSDYERLYTFASVLVAGGGYQAQSSYDPIFCSSRTIGSYTYTDCY